MQGFLYVRPVFQRCQIHLCRPFAVRSRTSFRELERRYSCCFQQSFRTPRASQPSRTDPNRSRTSCSAASADSQRSSQPHQAPQWPSRDALCGQQSLDQEGRRIALCGWVHRARNMGGIVFADLRDHSGILQASPQLFTTRLLRLRRNISRPRLPILLSCIEHQHVKL